jgi:hypothetical protein
MRRLSAHALLPGDRPDGLAPRKAFENPIKDEQGRHSEAIPRLSIRIQGIRPPLFSEGLRQPLHEVSAFRHMVVQAYELELDPGKRVVVLKYARELADRLPGLVEEFVRRVARLQQIGLSGPCRRPAASGSGLLLSSGDRVIQRFLVRDRLLSMCLRSLRTPALLV